MRCSTCDSIYERTVQTFVINCGKVAIPGVKLSVLVCPKCKHGIVEVGLFVHENKVTIQGVVEE